MISYCLDPQRLQNVRSLLIGSLQRLHFTIEPVDTLVVGWLRVCEDLGWVTNKSSAERLDAVELTAVPVLAGLAPSIFVPQCLQKRLQPVTSFPHESQKLSFATVFAFVVFTFAA